MTKQVIVIGSINMDIVVDTARMPVMGETISGSDVHYFLGGKGANQAVAAARWAHQSDVEVHFFGCVGRDAFGEAARHQLAKEPLQLHVTTDDANATGIALIQHVGSDNAIIVVPGANDAVALTEEMLSTMQADDVLLLQHEIPIPTVTALLQAAKERGLTTIVNPAPYEDAITDLLPSIDFITPNETETASLLGTPTLPDNPESLLLDFYRMYQTDICVTLGDKGVAWVDADGYHELGCPLVDAMDTTGAGDTFSGVLASELAQGNAKTVAIQHAITAASYSVTKLGAQSGMPYQEEV